MSKRSLYWIWTVLTCFSASTHAQEVVRGTEHLDSHRPEAWAMFYMTSVTLPSGLGTLQRREPGTISVGLELGSFPSLDKDQRTVGFNGTKEEDLNKAPVFIRPHLGIGLPGEFSLVLAYVPPLRVYGLKPHLFAAILERPLLQGSRWSIGGRLYAQTGTVEGDFTCSSNVANKPPGSPQNPFGCEEKSSDEATQRYAGFEIIGNYRIDGLGDLRPFISISANYLDTKVRVGATTFGVVDRTKLMADDWNYGLSAGLSYAAGKRQSFSAGVFYSPLQVRRDFESTASQNDSFVNFRALFSYQLP